MWVILKLLIIVSSVLVLPTASDPFWRPKEAAFIFLGLLFLASCWLNRNQNRYVFKNRWLTFFFIYIVVNFAWYYLRSLVFDNQGIIVWEHWLLIPTLNIIIAILMIHHLVEYTDSIEQWVGVIKIICWVGVGFSVYAILQYFGFDQIFPKVRVEEGTGITGPAAHIDRVYYMFTFLGNKMLSSNFIACITPLFIIFRKRKYYAGLAVCLFALCLYRSAFNLGIAIISICIIILLQGKWKVSLGIIFLSLALLLIFRNQTNFMYQLQGNFNFGGRMFLYKEVLGKSADRILTGRGVGSVAKDFNFTNSTQSMRRGFHSSHNILIDMLYETGLIGIALMLGYLYNLIRRVINAFLSEEGNMLLIGLCGAFVGWLLIAQGSFPHRIAPLALMGILYIAGIEVNLSQRRNIV